MSIEVLGISGSPIENSNTDRLIQAVLDATELEFEFVKLSQINIRPCLACKQCVPDNICKVKDDFPELAERIKKAKALIIGAYIPYKQIDGFTKALLERFWSLRHVNNLLRGKLCATVVTYLSPDAADNVNQSLATELKEVERMELIGRREFIGTIAGGMAAGGAYHEKIQTPIVGRHDVIVCGSTGGQRQNPPTPAQCQTVTEIALEPER